MDGSWRNRYQWRCHVSPGFGTDIPYASLLTAYGYCRRIFELRLRIQANCRSAGSPSWNLSTCMSILDLMAQYRKDGSSSPQLRRTKYKKGARTQGDGVMSCSINSHQLTKISSYHPLNKMPKPSKAMKAKAQVPPRPT